MSAVLEEISPCRRKLNVELSTEEVDKEYNEALDAFSTHMSLPGFRPGKAPRSLVKSRYDKEIRERLRDQLLPKSYQEALQEHELDVIQIVDMDDEIEIKPGEVFQYSVTVDVRPTIVLPEYKGISLNSETEEVSQDEVDARVEELRGSRAKYEDVEGRAVVRGDMAQVDLEASFEGQPLEEAVPEAKGLGTFSDFWMQASDEAFLPELGLALDGMEVDSNQTISVTIPEDFTIEALRGKEISYDVTLKGIRGRELPELDDEFASAMGMDSVDALLEEVKKSLGAEKDRQAQDKLRAQIEEFLLEGTEFELPESLVNEFTNRQLQQVTRNLQRQGMSEDQMLEQKDELIASVEDSAKRGAKMRLIMEKIAGEENIRVAQAELKQEMMMMAYSMGMKPEDLEKQVQSNNGMDEVAADIRIRKTMQMLLDEASIS